MIRRIQKVGASTYTVSLPKEWVKSNGLDAKSEVDVQIMEDGSIRISTLSSRKKEREILIKEKEGDVGFLIRKIMAAYIAGYDIIRVDLSEILPKFEGRDKLRKIIKSKMAGGEIIEESINHIIIQIIFRPYEYPLNKILMRMATLVHDMILDVCRALSIKNRDILMDVIERDDDVDKLYFMGSRWLASIVEDSYSSIDHDIESAREVLEYRIVFRHVERVADHMCKIATILLNLFDKLDDDHINVIRELLEGVGTIFVRSVNCIKTRNLLDANKVIHDARVIIKSSEDALTGNLLLKKEVNKLIIALDSIRRIAEYGIGISEIAFNMNI
ncbi:MAG: phosphate uptake regulator PhoU [Candidatus Methanomethyliaceae archaeon]|nr:phosphate uptake regulator PhoU [Candidatus Methanomethyliaceae archaeon]MDW7970419.1 phosphate uptake regulator PhoU [Nitrososphaerota archaeon]